MSNLIKRAIIERRNDRHPVMKPVGFDINNTIIEHNDSFAGKHTYRLSVEMHVDFRANSAEMDTAKKIAEKVLLQWIYSDVLSHLELLRMYVISGQNAEALAVMDEMQREIGL
jgi:hypothetical protein